MSASPQRLILRNTLLLVGAQVIAAPLAMLVNAVAARTLGSADFGVLYLATTFGSLAFLFVEWGQPMALTSLVARDRAGAGQLMGSGLAIRACLAPLVISIALAACAIAGYDQRFLVVLALVLLASAFATVSGACQDVIRGYERSEMSAAAVIGFQLLTTLVVVPTLIVTSRLPAYLIAQAACAAIGAVVLICLVPSLGVRRLSANWRTSKTLLGAGTSFLFFNLVLALQPGVDAVFLSKLASPEAIGWQAVARKLTGLLIFPASALTAALYPTLSRLHGENMQAFRSAAASALRTTPIVAVPLALGCVLFPQIGIDLFGRGIYGRAMINIQILAAFVLLLYLTMPLSATLLAAGKQRAWVAAQFACVILTAVLDPLLIPWFQSHMSNGGLGVCISTVAGEIMLLATGICLLPSGIIDRSHWRSYGSTVSAGTVMVFVGLALSWMSPYLAAPLAIIAFFGCLWLTGGLDKGQIDVLRSLLRK